MKKVSTAVVKATKNFSQPKLTIGLDLGDRSSWYCLLDEVGEVLLEQKLGTTQKAMGEVFGSMPRSRIALETGMHSITLRTQRSGRVFRKEFGSRTDRLQLVFAQAPQVFFTEAPFVEQRPEHQGEFENRYSYLRSTSFRRWVR